MMHLIYYDVRYDIQRARKNLTQKKNRETKK